MIHLCLHLLREHMLRLDRLEVLLITGAFLELSFLVLIGLLFWLIAHYYRQLLLQP